jgi:tRNA pseudouridine55 synthase
MVRYEGILLVDKPYGMTSHDVIDELRKILQQKKIGHTGTLDPRATGLLVICLERATKVSQFLIDEDKTYEAQIKLGERSTTFDEEGVIENADPPEVPDLTEAEIESILAEFKGKLTQKVPDYSAVKIAGEPLYKKARKGKKIDAPEREIEIKNIKLLKSELPRIDFSVTCSKGTYIRTLANDTGERIGCGAYLSRLRRTVSGPFKIDDALTLKEIKHYRDAGALKKFIHPIEDVLPFPSIKINESFAPFIISGRSPQIEDIETVEGDFTEGDYISLRDHKNKILAVGTSTIPSNHLKESRNSNFFRYVRVLN